MEPAKPENVPCSREKIVKNQSAAADVQRIAFCHLESLTCLPALNRLFAAHGDRIGLVLVSRRFDTAHGGFFAQLTASVRKSGVGMTFWLGFDLIAAQVVAGPAGKAARLLFCLGGRPALETLPALARRHGAMVVETGDINATATLDRLRAYAPDALLVMNFDQILKPAAIAVPRRGALNIHPSLLPALRGPCPVFWALVEGRTSSGATLHRIEDARIDAGAILRQAEQPIDRRQSVAEINTRLFLAGVGALGDVLEDLAAGRPGTPPGPGQYRGFPSSTEAAAARRAGVRLCHLWFAVRLIAATLGIGRGPDAAPRAEKKG